MSKTRYAFLLFLVLAAGGLTVLVAGLAISSGKLNGQTAMSLMPLLLLLSVAVKALRPDGKE